MEESIHCSLNYIIFIIPSAGCGCYMCNIYFYWIIPSVTHVVAMFRITKVWTSSRVKEEIYFWMVVRQGRDLCENWNSHSRGSTLLTPAMWFSDWLNSHPAIFTYSLAVGSTSQKMYAPGKVSVLIILTEVKFYICWKLKYIFHIFITLHM